VGRREGGRRLKESDAKLETVERGLTGIRVESWEPSAISDNDWK